MEKVKNRKKLARGEYALYKQGVSKTFEVGGQFVCKLHCELTEADTPAPKPAAAI